MVGAGKVIQLLFGMNRASAVVLVGADGDVRDVRRHAGHHPGCRIIKAVIPTVGASFMAFMVLASVGFSPETRCSTRL